MSQDFDEVDALLAGMQGVTKLDNPVTPTQTVKVEKTKKPRKRQTKSKEKHLASLEGELESNIIEVDPSVEREYKIKILVMPMGSPQMQTISIVCWLNYFQVKYIRDYLLQVETKLAETNEPQSLHFAYKVAVRNDTGEIIDTEEESTAVIGCVGIIHNLPLIRSISIKE